jgi:hypothetical protein
MDSNAVECKYGLASEDTTLFRTHRLAFLLLAAITASPAMADVILTPADGGTAFVGPTEGNFTIVSTAGAAIYSLGPSNGIYTGVGDGAGWTITATDGGAFTFAGLDTSAVGYPSRVDIVLTGTPEDGGAAIVADIAAVGTAILPDSLASVTLSSLTISGFGYDDGGFIMTSGFANVTVSEVPEPVSMAVLAIGLAGIGLVRRRRCAFSP